jgi:hypothetical protein
VNPSALAAGTGRFLLNEQKNFPPRELPLSASGKPLVGSRGLGEIPVRRPRNPATLVTIFWTAKTRIGLEHDAPPAGAFRSQERDAARAGLGGRLRPNRQPKER